MQAHDNVPTFVLAQQAGELSPMGVGIERMPMDANSLTLNQIVAHLSRLAEEWHELLKNHEAMVHELHSTKDELQKVLRELGNTKAEYDQSLNQRDEILGILNSLLSRYGKDRAD